jgi:hypothetical protein
MLNSHKLLYILPDLAYIAELLPGKKPHDFSIQSFKQINGSLLDGNKLLTSNLKKLAGKLEAEKYQVILPDTVFTNTILNVEADSKTAVKDYLETNVFPDLHVDSDSHQVEDFILTELKGTYKVQLSTVQRKMLRPLGNAFAKSEASIERIYPLSWTIKSLVSLEPSITILQLGNYLYLAKHYIGIDQPIMNKLDKLDRTVEAAKSLKGAEPTIQTAYILSNEVVETKIKDKLSEVLPIQQLASHDDKEAKIPSYVAKIIETGMQTLSIEDFDLPSFKAETGDLDEEDLDEEAAETSEKKQELPEPSGPDQEQQADKEAKEPEAEVEQEDLDDESLDDEPGESVSQSQKDQDQKSSESKSESKTKSTAAKSTAEEGDDQAEQTSSKKPAQPAQPTQADKKQSSKKEEVQVDETEEVDLEQFIDQSQAKAKSTQLKNKKTKAAGTKKTERRSKKAKAKKSRSAAQSAAQSAQDEVVKNKDGVGSFLKVFLIGLVSFAATVAVGVGIGLGVLKLTEPDNGDIETPVAQPSQEVSPTAEPTATATPTPSIARAEVKLKVVNATTKPGYAGETKAQLEEAGYEQVEAKNARGDYESGFYLLMEEENPELLSVLSQDTGFELEYSSEVEVEDPKGEFDAVLVLAQESED